MQSNILTTTRRSYEMRLALIFYFSLYALNTVRVVLLVRWETHLSATGVLGDFVATCVDVLVKSVIWFSLTFFFISREKKRFSNVCKVKKHVLKGILTGLAGCLIIVIIQIIPGIMDGHLHLRPPINSLYQIVPVVLAGFIEEFAFRGYLLDKFLVCMDDIYALGLNAVLFVLKHIPIWLVSGISPIGVLWNGLLILPLCLFYVGATIWSDSIWSSIIIHAVTNFFDLIIRVT